MSSMLCNLDHRRINLTRKLNARNVYIFANKFTTFNLIKSYLASIFHDTKYHIRHLEFKELLLSFVRRFVYQYGYFKGFKNGERRKQQNQTATYGNYQ